MSTTAGPSIISVARKHNKRGSILRKNMAFGFFLTASTSLGAVFWIQKSRSSKSVVRGLGWHIVAAEGRGDISNG
jgi:hypothetical protein